MDDKEALELLDAHLDHELLTPDQAAALRVWVSQHPEHADRAFRRIFLHAFLREGLQHTAIPATAIRTLRDEPNLEMQVLQGELIPVLDPPELLKRRRPSVTRWIGAGVALCLFALIGWFAVHVWFSRAGPPGGLWVYEGFDYAATSPPAPLGDGNKWPTSGGMEGLSGGIGWKEPWKETAAKVSILIADVQANAWRASDMRKFGPLGYSDTTGNVLQSTGIQLRTAAGPLSATSRKLNVAAFPNRMSDDRGLGIDGAVIWLSFLAQSFDGRGLGNFAYVQLGTDAAGLRLGKLLAVPSGNWSACVIQDGAEMNVRWSDIPSGQAVLMVTRLTFRPGGEEADVWINPSLEKEPAANTETLRISLPDFRWNQLTIRSRYTTDFDEIRVGRTFRDVTPVR